jgi:hypothetical protein
MERDTFMIVYTLIKEKFPFHGKLKSGAKHAYNSAKVSGFSKSRVYLTVYGDVCDFQSVPLTEIAKQMHFENGKVYIFDDHKNKVEIGSYVMSESNGKSLPA